MMKKVQGRVGQSMVDLALMYCGSADYAYDIAKANGLDADATLLEDALVEVPVVESRVSQDIERKGVIPYTGTISDDPWNVIGLAMVGELTVR